MKDEYQQLGRRRDHHRRASHRLDSRIESNVEHQRANDQGQMLKITKRHITYLCHFQANNFRIRSASRDIAVVRTKDPGARSGNLREHSQRIYAWFTQ